MEKQNAIVSKFHMGGWEVAFVNESNRVTDSVFTCSFREAVAYARSKQPNRIYARHNWLERCRKGRGGWHKIAN